MTTTFDETQHPRGEGGRFATKPASESGVSLDQAPAPSTNMLTPDPEQTRADLGEAFTRFDEAHRSGDFDALHEARNELRTAAIRHASTGDDSSAEVEGLNHVELYREDTKNWARVGRYSGHVSRGWARTGVGDHAEQVSVAQARRELPVGAKVQVSYLGAPPDRQREGADAPRTVVKQNDYEMITQADGGEPVHNDWAGKTAHVDATGNIIVSHRDGQPYVAYTVLDDR